MAKKSFDLSDNPVPSMPQPNVNPLKYMLIGLLLALLIMAIIIKFKNYTLLIYEPKVTPQYLDVLYEQDADVNSLILMNVEEVKNTCHCKACFGCRVAYKVNTQQAKRINETETEIVVYQRDTGNDKVGFYTTPEDFEKVAIKPNTNKNG